MCYELNTNNGVDGIVGDDAERNSLSFDFQVRLEDNSISAIVYFVFYEKVHLICFGVGFEF